MENSNTVPLFVYEKVVAEKSEVIAMLNQLREDMANEKKDAEISAKKTSKYCQPRYFFFSYAYYGDGTQGTGNICINCLEFPPIKSVAEEIKKNSKYGIIDVVISGWQEMTELDFQQANSLT